MPQIVRALIAKVFMEKYNQCSDFHGLIAYQVSNTNMSFGNKYLSDNIFKLSKSAFVFMVNFMFLNFIS